MLRHDKSIVSVQCGNNHVVNKQINVYISIVLACESSTLLFCSSVSIFCGADIASHFCLYFFSAEDIFSCACFFLTNFCQIGEEFAVTHTLIFQISVRLVELQLLLCRIYGGSVELVESVASCAEICPKSDITISTCGCH